MAQARLTDQSVLEAGIAAHLAANSDLLPPEVSELSDQAALFASNNTNAFMFTGSADADSENTNFGDSLATKAIEKVIELDERRRKEDDPAGDASMIAELAASQRERLAAMQDVTVGGVTLTLEEWDEIAEILSTEGGQDQLKALLMAEGKSEAEADQIVYLTEMAARIAQKEGSGQPLTAEEREVQQRLENNQVDRDRLEIGVASTQNLPEFLAQNDLPPEVQIQRDSVIMADEAGFVVVQEEIMAADGYSAEEADEYAETALNIREGMSSAGNPFEAAYSPAPEFNVQAEGSAQLAQAKPVQSTPTVSSPVLS